MIKCARIVFALAAVSMLSAGYADEVKEPRGEDQVAFAATEVGDDLNTSDGLSKDSE